MKKEYVIGGLAIVGAIALVAYLRKPKRNEDGFFGATGMGKFASTSRGRIGRCKTCRTSDGTEYNTGSDRTCSGSDICVLRYAYL
jgi:hypothetical protein